MNTSSRECDHRRGRPRNRSSAVTVCCCCRNYLCSICGVTIKWHEGLYITNPVLQWRYCARHTCVEVEAAYHTLPVDEMIQYRDALRAKRLLRNLQDRGIEPQALPLDTLMTQVTAGGAQRIFITSRAFMLDPGEACWCNLGKDCVGDHELGPIEVVNVCGDCGRTFQISDNDPHWSTGRGPICPTGQTHNE